MGYQIDPKASIGYVRLKVSDLNRSVPYYTEVIGFQILKREGNVVSLTADGRHPLLVLEESLDAIPKPPRTTGLYHFAILLPDRPSLGRCLAHLINNQYAVMGASDHEYSEALYLTDPDRNGIEIYADRPRTEWKLNELGELPFVSDPIDAEGLLAEAGNQPWKGLPKGTIMGHVHLHVADIPKSGEFYHDVLGFDITSRLKNEALFVSAGGYHHHIGLNTWNGVGAPKPPQESVGLQFFTIQFENESAIKEVEARLVEQGYNATEREDGIYIQDPSGNGILLVIMQP